MTLDKSIKVTTSIDINASIESVWFALTNKEMIKQYFFGTETNTDWREGSPVSFSGIWEGTEYEDKGIILKIEKGKLLKYSYRSSFWGEEYSIDDFSIITYELSKNGQYTVLAVCQEGFKDLQSGEHSLNSWREILSNIKNLIQK